MLLIVLAGNPLLKALIVVEFRFVSAAATWNARLWWPNAITRIPTTRCTQTNLWPIRDDLSSLPCARWKKKFLRLSRAVHHKMGGSMPLLHLLLQLLLPVPEIGSTWLTPKKPWSSSLVNSFSFPWMNFSIVWSFSFVKDRSIIFLLISNLFQFSISDVVFRPCILHFSCNYIFNHLYSATKWLIQI